MRILFLLSLVFLQGDFLSQQKKYDRVREAIAEKQGNVVANLQANDLTLNDYNLLIIAYKEEDVLELYAKKKTASTYKRIKAYEVCNKSGVLGPKRKQGDLQVPEGFYYIDRFNPVSNFYLSLGLNYPNEADKIKGVKGNLGGDIFIHGSCVTVGCLPMTDDIIKEIYLYAVYAKNNGQKEIPVYVFPFKMTEPNYIKHLDEFPEHKEFWKNLKTGFDRFGKDKKELKVTVSKSGMYVY